MSPTVRSSKVQRETKETLAIKAKKVCRDLPGTPESKVTEVTMVTRVTLVTRERWDQRVVSVILVHLAVEGSKVIWALSGQLVSQESKVRSAIPDLKAAMEVQGSKVKEVIKEKKE